MWVGGEAIGDDAQQRDIELGKKIPRWWKRAFHLVLKLCINGGNCAIWWMSSKPSVKIEVMIECFPTLGSSYVKRGPTKCYFLACHFSKEKGQPIISVLFDHVSPLKKNIGYCMCESHPHKHSLDQPVVCLKISHNYWKKSLLMMQFVGLC